MHPGENVMSEEHQNILQRVEVVRYGTTLIEDQAVPCCLGRDLMIYIPVAGVCSVIKVNPEDELRRIMEHRSLRQGLALISFAMINEETQEAVKTDLPCISLTRLHSWLNMIPAEEVLDEDMGKRLALMQDQLADLIYAYMGRPLLPEDIKVEREQSLAPEQARFYQVIEEVSHVKEDLSATQDSVEKMGKRLGALEVALSLRTPDGSFIDKRQQVSFAGCFRFTKV
jgi:hypothetical protein